jgi:hypothetical protein
MEVHKVRESLNKNLLKETLMDNISRFDYFVCHAPAEPWPGFKVPDHAPKPATDPNSAAIATTRARVEWEDRQEIVRRAAWPVYWARTMMSAAAMPRVDMGPL